MERRGCAGVRQGVALLAWMMARVSHVLPLMVDCLIAQTVDVVELFRPDKDIRYYLDYQALREHRQRLDCRQVILTHMGQDMLNHLTEVEFECAEDGKIVVL